MKHILVLFCYFTGFILVCRWTHSTSGALVLGLGTILLLDRYLLHVLPWREPGTLIQALWIRGGYILAGAVGIYFLHRGMVLPLEAVAVGFVLSNSALLLECMLGWMSRSGTEPKNPKGRAKLRLFMIAALMTILIIVLSPLSSLHLPHTVALYTPHAFGLDYEDVRFRTEDGLELRGWLIPSAQRRGSVIFCHGHGVNRGQVAAHLESMHELGLNILAFDFRGHGKSQGHTLTFGDREILDVIAAESFLAERYPESLIFLVGVSYGAGVSLQALPKLSRVRGVWFDSPFARLMNVVEQRFSFVPAPLRGPLVRLYDFIAWIDCGFWASDINPIDHLVQVRIPIHFCHGREDRLIPFSESQALFDAYTGPKSSFWVEEANHFDLQEMAGQEYFDRFHQFFESLMSDGESRVES